MYCHFGVSPLNYSDSGLCVYVCPFLVDGYFHIKFDISSRPFDYACAYLW